MPPRSWAGRKEYWPNCLPPTVCGRHRLRSAPSAVGTVCTTVFSRRRHRLQKSGRATALFWSSRSRLGNRSSSQQQIPEFRSVRTVDLVSAQAGGQLGFPVCGMDRAAVLQQELDELRAQITALEKALEEKPDYGLGRGDPGVTRWELDQALLRRLKQRATEIERALSRVGQGTYGICVRCGRPIHPDRLAVLPDTQICIKCAQAGERT